MLHRKRQDCVRLALNRIGFHNGVLFQRCLEAANGQHDKLPLIAERGSTRFDALSAHRNVAEADILHDDGILGDVWCRRNASSTAARWSLSFTEDALDAPGLFIEIDRADVIPGCKSPPPTRVGIE